jgi:hypothetical protein
MARPAPRTRARTTWVVTLGFGLVALFLAVSGARCEVIVPGSVEPFRCGSTESSSCPTGEMCATSTGQCVSVSQACTATQCTPPLVCDPGSLQCVSATMMMADASMIIPDASMPPMVDSARPLEDVMATDSGNPGDASTGAGTPTTCGQANGTIGCCGANGELYYCSSSGSLKTKQCLDGQACGWISTNGYYGCVEPPAMSDPSGANPIGCQ